MLTSRVLLQSQRFLVFLLVFVPVRRFCTLVGECHLLIVLTGGAMRNLPVRNMPQQDCIAVLHVCAFQHTAWLR